MTITDNTKYYLLLLAGAVVTSLLIACSLGYIRVMYG